MHPATATVEPTLAATRPTRRYKPCKSSQSSQQLIAVLAAVKALAELTDATGAEKRRLERKYQQLLGAVVTSFKRATKRLARGFHGLDYLGQAVTKEDLDQAVALGVSEGVARYKPNLAGGGCVNFILSRVRFMIAASSFSVMPPRSATRSPHVSSNSHTSRSGKFSLMFPLRSFTSR